MPINFDLLDYEIFNRVYDVIRRWWQIDVLVVTDTIVSFAPEHNPINLNETYFGMSHLIGVLESVGAVIKAHRSTDPLGAAGVISNFTFDNHDLSMYDQIWLPFGPWDWPYPGPDDGPLRPPIPPVALAQAALGAAILAVHEMGPKELLSRSAVEQLTGVGLRGVRQALDNQIDTTRQVLMQLERTAELFAG